MRELLLLLLRGDLRDQRVDLRLRLLRGLPGYGIGIDQRLVAHQVAPRLFELRLILGAQRGCGLELRLRLRQRGLLRSILEPREHLAGRDLLALFDQHLGQRARDLRRDGRLAACGHVTGRL